MLLRIKKYIPEILVFSIIWGIYILDVAPNMTWINTNSDGVHLTFSSHYLYLAHKTSAPLYLLLGHFFQMIPIGTDYWRMGLMSVLGSIGVTVFIYLTIKKILPTAMSNNKKRLYALIGVLVYGSSALALSQTIIVKYYTLVTMMCLGAYYFSLKAKWSMSALMLGLGLALHHLIGIALIPMILFNKELRRPKQLIIMASGLLFYLYLPISIKIFHSPDMWGNETVSSFFGDNFSTMMMLVGGLSIWDLPKRILDTIGILGLSLGFGFVITIIYIIKEKHILKNQLFWLFVLSILYFVSDLSPQTYVYVLPAIAFGAIIVGYQLSKVKPIWLYTTAFVSILLLSFNANYFDIGRTLDKNLSATEFYKVELPKIPDGQILMAQYGWQWAMIMPYDKNNNRNIIPIDIDTLVSPIYQGQLKEEGIKFDDNFDKNIATRQAFIANSIVSMNDNVWTTKTTDGSTYGAEVVKAKDYAGMNMLPTEPPAQLHWKPSNPLLFITGSIEVSDWKFITYSNKNVRFYVLVLIYALIPYLLFFKWWDRRNKTAENNV